MRYQASLPGKNPQLWHIVCRSALFKTSLASYMLFSSFFWTIWYFAGVTTHDGGFPWPVRPMLCSGLCLFLQYMTAYGNRAINPIDKEYDQVSQFQNK